ncbi:MAG: ROK family protein [Chloroflexi bacterium]|nr:ROK family protein [Chloroflexota bacterium]
MSTYLRCLPALNAKNINKHAVLDLIRFTPSGISRVELAQRVHLTRAAVSTIVTDLLTSGTIREAESRSVNSGRPPILLEINPGGGYVAGIDMGASHMTVIIANYAAHIVEEKEVPLDIAQGPKASIAQADQILRELLSTAKIPLKHLRAIGIGVPGPIVADAGMVLAPPIMPGWDRFPIRDTLEKMWGCPVSLNNDAELGAMGEWAYGAGRGEQNLAYIKVGTGIGSGLLLDGHIYRGATGSAGEIGHLIIKENGAKCTCGNRGCLEAMAGGMAIARQAQAAVRDKKRTRLADIKPIKSLTAQHVAAAARHGDLIAQQILSQAGHHVGVAIAGLVNLFNPNMVVVGGGVAQIGDLFIEPVRETVQKHSLPAATQAVRITTALLGRRSSSMGAAIQALTIALHRGIEKKELAQHRTAK